MKFVVREIATYSDKDLYFEAESKAQVVRHLLSESDDVVEYMDLLFSKHKNGQFGWIKECNKDPVGDCDEEFFEDMYSQYTEQDWYKYINIEIPVCYKLYKKYQRKILGKEEFTRQILKILDDQSCDNIFTFFNTNGSGYQWGNPLHEGHTIEIEEYKEPNFVKI